MSLRPQPVDRLRRPRGWLIPAAFLALTPKCVLCLLAYAGVGAALGLGGPEICGAVAGPARHWALLLPAFGIAPGLACLAVAASRRRVALRFRA